MADVRLERRARGARGGTGVLGRKKSFKSATLRDEGRDGRDNAHRNLSSENKK